jgi:hypothetical protein
MKKIVGLLLQCVCLFGSVLPVMAHHAFAAEFDDKKPLTLEGAGVRFEFMNPHSWIYLDVKSPSALHDLESRENGPCGERIHFQARLSIAVVLSQFYTARIVFPLEATSSEPNPF